MAIYIYSTLSNDQLYTNYGKSQNNVPQKTSEVFIAGKANITNKNFITPKGAATEVTAEQLADLKKNAVFNMHVKNGYIKIDDKKQEVEKATSDMKGRDESAPLVEDDFKNDEKPVSNAKKK